MALFGPNIKKLQAANDVEGLVEALGHTRPAIRAEAAGALGVERLLAVLQDTGAAAEVRGAAAEGLGKLGDPRAVEPLLSALGDDQVATHAARALGRLGEPQSLGPIVDFFLAHMRQRLTPALRTAMENHGPKDSAVAMGGMVKMELQDVVESIASFGSTGLDRLASALRDENDWLVRWGIAAALIEIGPEGKQVVESESHLLHDEAAGAPTGPSATVWVPDEESAQRLLSGDPQIFAQTLTADGSPAAMAFLGAVSGTEVGSTISGTIHPNSARGGVDVKLVLKPKDS
jgi:HEAT repeat protein